jgi:transcriptional regulator with XRE-family HTH domain
MSSIIDLAHYSDMSFHEFFRLMRTSRGVSARDLSLRCDLSASYISKMEAGTTTPPVNTFMKLVRELGITDAEMLFMLGLCS